MNPKSENKNLPAPYIVGFAQELQMLTNWLASFNVESQIFSISGIGGIGKTTLLTEMAAEARRCSTVTLWLDGQICLQTPGAFLSHVEMSLETEYGRTRPADTPLLAHVVAELTHQRTVVVIDNCEKIDRIDSWLLSRLLPLLAASEFLLIVASRAGLPVQWNTNPLWVNRIHSFSLELLTRQEVHEYVQSSGLPLQVQKDIVHKIDGHPLLLALTVDMLRRKGREREEYEHQLPRILSAEILKEATSPYMYEALQMLSLFPAADQTMLNQLLDHPLSAVDYMALSTLSCVRPGAGGLSLHQLVSRMLREDYKTRDPGHYQLMRSRALELLAERYPSVNKLLQMQIAAHTLELYREQLPTAHSYADFSIARQREQEQQMVFESDDLPYLQRFLAASLSRSDWQSELIENGQYSSLLDDIAKHVPEGIRVIRNADRVPLAFCAGLWLHAKTVSILEQYAPNEMKMLGEAIHLARSLPPEAADTICILLAAVDVEQASYRPEELGGMLFQSWLIDAMNGLRSIIPTADRQLNTLLPHLGFEELTMTAQPNAWDDMHIWELDFRQASFEVWVRRILRQKVQTSGFIAQEVPRVLSWNEVRQMLQHIYDDTLLEEMATLKAMGCGGVMVRELVVSILYADQPTDPLTALGQRILRESYLHNNYRKTELAEALHMSRATFYRHLRQAYKQLGHVIMQRWMELK
ncbi:bacterio-opsin activator [Paenibacillus xylanilyticus]|uniref:Bacterio-opsin activator n=1 Tax=Paenibacillus xylanilyticus TaxID=248903 RepID=A0A7Y6EXG3_9BACL|nr:bacterio-opsin activator [Paenibacillus xylanilyticus]NUU77753.1 bacterio-opsin activator [Paenibacillus xylanilyticus]